MARDYKAEYKNYHSKPKQKKARASRNAARAAMKAGGVAVAGKDVAHKDGNALNNKRSNLKTSSKKANRSFPRTRSAKKKNAND
jgi:hypothetical protein